LSAAHRTAEEQWYEKRNSPTAKHKEAIIEARHLPALAGVDRAEVVRRVLLGLVTALIVARPLLPGEDPGRTLPTTGIAGQDIAFLWLLAAAGWSAWRVWSRQTTWPLSRVEIGLTAFVGVVFISAAFAARYKHPAWLISWEWLAVLAAFVVIRQLPHSEAENRGLLSAVLASAVSLAAFGIYQAVQPTPPTSPVDSLLAEIFGLDPPRRVEGSLVKGTFAESNSFAAFLTMVAPALALGWYLVQNAGRPPWQVVLTGICFALVCLCLGMTRSWPAVSALAVVSLIFLLAVNGPVGAVGLRATLLLAALGVGAVIALAAFSQDFQEALSARMEYASTTWKMIGDHFWLGVGPGNFGRHYPAYIDSPAAERVAQPDNFFLETLATAGFFAAAALIIAIVGFVRRIWPEIRRGWPQTEEGPDPADADVSSPSRRRTRWEFYVGGIVGLTLAFLLGPSGSSTDEMVLLAGVAAVRSMVWFGAFALLEAVPWTERWTLLALAAGVLAGLLCLLGSGGFFYPSLAQPLWIMAALALNATPESRPIEFGGRFALLLPVPILVVLCWIHLLVVLAPLGGAARPVYRARLAYPAWLETVEPQWRKVMEGAEPPADKFRAALRADNFLEQVILKPLQEAVEPEPGDANLQMELAYWRGQGRELFVPIRDVLDQPERRKLQQQRAKYSLQEIDPPIKVARTLDPVGKPSYWVASHLWLRFAREPGLSQREQAERYYRAAQHLLLLIERDPLDIRAHYRLADALVKTGDSELVARGHQHAQQALKLAGRTDPAKLLLNPSEWQQLEEWSKLPKEGD
jgi:O-antigen ligase